MVLWHDATGLGKFFGGTPIILRGSKAIVAYHNANSVLPITYVGRGPR